MATHISTVFDHCRETVPCGFIAVCASFQKHTVFRQSCEADDGSAYLQHFAKVRHIHLHPVYNVLLVFFSFLLWILGFFLSPFYSPSPTSSSSSSSSSSDGVLVSQLVSALVSQRLPACLPACLFLVSLCGRWSHFAFFVDALQY